MGLVVLSCALWLPRAVAAQSDAASVEEAVTHLHWSAPRTCPSALEVQVLARRRLGARASARLLLVDAWAEVTRSGRRFSVVLRAGEVERHLDSPSCASIARAVAYVFASWVVDGPEPEPSEAEPSGEIATPVTEETVAEATVSEGTVSEDTVTEEAATEETATEETVTEDTVTEETVIGEETTPPDGAEPGEVVGVAPEASATAPELALDRPLGRAPLRFIGQLLTGYVAFATPNVEPTVLASFGLGIDWFEVDLGPLLLLGLTSWGLGPDGSDRFFVVGARVRTGVTFEIGPEWEIGGHLLAEVAWLGLAATGASDDDLFATFGAGLDVRFYPIPSLEPDLGLAFSLQWPFSLRRSEVQLPSGLAFQLDWATLTMGLGLVVRIP